MFMGAIGERYGTPTDRIEAMCISSTTRRLIIPYIPKNEAAIINGNLIRRRAGLVVYPGTANDEIAVSATTIIMAWETMPA